MQRDACAGAVIFIFSGSPSHPMSPGVLLVLRTKIAVCKCNKRTKNAARSLLNWFYFPSFCVQSTRSVQFMLQQVWCAYHTYADALWNHTIQWHRTIYVFVFRYEHDVSQRNFDPIDIESNVHLSLFKTFVRWSMRWRWWVANAWARRA